MSDDERPAALLTKAQREYLRGERPDYSSSTEREVKQRIRERIGSSVDDISLLVERLDLEELKKAIGGESHKWGDLVALVVLADEVLSDTEPRGAEGDPFPELSIENGIGAALRRLGQSWETIDVTIERGGPLDDLAQKDLTELSESELDQLRMAHKITREEYADEVIRRREKSMSPEARQRRQEMRENAAAYDEMADNSDQE